jgi:prolipoprotein diacylglyceryltransferase
MKPVLVELGGFQVHSYGVSKALAALVAGWLLQLRTAAGGAGGGDRRTLR